MSALIADRLRKRIRTAGADPLITYYDLAAGVRTELSAVTFGNWVDKTCNLATDELDLEPGDVVELAVAVTNPAHWVTACWQLACWELGLVVSVGSGWPARVIVTGPKWQPYEGVTPVVACSLHPLGLGLAERPPAGVTDYALEVRGQPDGYAPTPQSGLRPAWADAERRLTQAELIAHQATPARRRLLASDDPWECARDGIVTALVSGGSVVSVVGGDQSQLAKIAIDERVDR